MADLVQFVWDVPKRGYRVVEAREVGHENHAAPSQFLVVADEQDDYAAYRYAPLATHRGLFKTFAEMNPTPENITVFANKYGWLGVGKFFEGPRLTGERLIEWKHHVLTLKNLVYLWELAERKDTKALGPYIVWHGNKGVMHKSPRKPEGLGFPQVAERIADREIRSEGFEGLRPNDVIEPAYYYLQGKVNKALKDKVSPGVLWEHGRLGLHMIPKNLLGAIWLQFAQAIDTSPEYRKCVQCRTWFEVSLEGHRKSRRYCSDACRAKAYRNRKQEKAQ